MTINDGGPAFPIPIAGCNDGGVYNTMEQSQGQLGGMTLRDYFAAKAMPFVAGRADIDNTGAVEWAAACYEIADAMLTARTNEG